MNTTKRKDSQKSGLAGELFAAAELLKRNYQVSLTFGNAKAIDLFVYNEDLNYTFNVQVKTLRSSNCFPINHEHIDRKAIYMFVLLNKPGKPVEFFIITGKQILQNKEKLFGKSLGKDSFSAINIGPIRKYSDNWQLFDNIL